MTVVCYSTIAAHTQAQNIVVDTTLSNIAFSSHSRNSPGARANRNVSPSMLMCLAVDCTLTHRISHIQRPLNVRAPSLTSRSPLLTPGSSVSPLPPSPVPRLQSRPHRPSPAPGGRLIPRGRVTGLRHTRMLQYNNTTSNNDSQS